MQDTGGKGMGACSRYRKSPHFCESRQKYPDFSSGSRQSGPKDRAAKSHNEARSYQRGGVVMPLFRIYKNLSLPKIATVW